MKYLSTIVAALAICVLVVLGLPTAEALSPVYNASVPHPACNGTDKAWDSTAYGITQMSTCSNRLWVCSRQKWRKEEQWTCKCNPLWNKQDGQDNTIPFGDINWPACVDSGEIRFEQFLPNVFMLCFVLCGICSSIYGIYLYFDNVNHGSKHNKLMLLNQALLLVSAALLVTLAFVNYFKAAGQVSDHHYAVLWAVLMPCMTFSSMQANLMIPGQWMEIFVNSSLKIAREERERQVSCLRIIVIVAQIVVTALAGVVTFVFDSSAVAWSGVWLVTQLFSIPFYCFGGERLSSFLIDSSKDSKSGEETRAVGTTIRFVSRTFVCASTISLVVMVWYSMLYTQIFSDGGTEHHAIMISFLFSYCVFLSMFVVLLGAANYFFIATHLRRRNRRMTRKGSLTSSGRSVSRRNSSASTHVSTAAVGAAEIEPKLKSGGPVMEP